MANAREAGAAAAGLGGLLAGRRLSIAGFSLALTGAGLAFGIMAARALREGIDYTAISWALIAPVWGVLALLALLVTRARVVALPLGWLSIFAGLYYADVFGYMPAAGLFLVATFVVFAPPAEPRRDDGA